METPEVFRTIHHNIEAAIPFLLVWLSGFVAFTAWRTKKLSKSLKSDIQRTRKVILVKRIIASILLVAGNIYAGVTYWDKMEFTASLVTIFGVANLGMFLYGLRSAAWFLDVDDENYFA